MAEVAVSYVSIVPKFAGGFKNAIAQQVDGAGEAAGRSVGGGFKSSFLAVLAGLGVAKVAGTIAGTIRGAIGGGFDRLMNIEQAQIKFRTLGLDVKKTMDVVAASVDGTKFAISDAADMAAFLGASGVKGGKDMQRWLAITADSAQFSNRAFADMQRVIGKVVAEGRVTGETFQEFPLAAAALAEQLGISQAEVRKLASEGKISADQFATAIEKKIGGSAKNAGASFLSMRDNLKTALNATMAALLEPFTKAAMPIMRVGLTLVKGFRDNVAKPLGASFSTWLQPRAEAFAKSLERLPALVSGVRNILGRGSFKPFAGLEEDSPVVAALLRIREAALGTQGVLSVLFEGKFLGSGSTFGLDEDSAFVSALFRIRDVARGFVTQMQGIFSRLDLGKALSGMAGLGGFVAGLRIMPLLGQLRTAITPLLANLARIGPAIRLAFSPLSLVVGLIAAALATSGDARSAVGGMLATLLEVGRTVASEVAPAIREFAVQVVPQLKRAFDAVVAGVARLLVAISPVVSALARTLGPVISTLVRTILPPLAALVREIVDALVTYVIPQIVSAAEIISRYLVPAIQFLAPFVQRTFQFLATTIGNAMTIIRGVIQTVSGLMSGDWSKAMEGLRTIASGIMAQLRNIVSTAMEWLHGVVAAIGPRLQATWSAIWGAIVAFVSSIPGRIVAALSALGAMLLGAATSALAQFRSGLTSGFNAAISFVRSIPAKLRAALGNLGSLLVDSGKALMRGFASGITSGVEGAKQAVSSGLGRIKRLFPHSPAPEGPFSGRGWVSYSGESVAEAFGQGFVDRADVARRKVEAALAPLQRAVTLSPSAGGLAVAGVGAVAGAAPKAAPTLNIYGPDAQEVAGHALAMLQHEQRVNEVTLPGGPR